MKRDVAIDQQAAGVPFLLILKLRKLSKMLCEKDQGELCPVGSSLFGLKVLKIKLIE